MHPGAIKTEEKNTEPIITKIKSIQIVNKRILIWRRKKDTCVSNHKGKKYLTPKKAILSFLFAYNREEKNTLFYNAKRSCPLYIQSDFSYEHGNDFHGQQ